MKTNISREELQHVLQLAALDAPELLRDDAAMESLRTELEHIAEWAAKLPDVATQEQDTVQAAHDARLREDLPQPGLSTRDALAPAARHDEALFLVPQVLP